MHTFFQIKRLALMALVFGSLASILAQNNNQPANNNATNAPSGIGGFDGNPWGTTYKDLKEKFMALAASGEVENRVDIVADFPGRELVISRKSILYRYVFYLKPQDLKKEDSKPAQPAAGPNDAPPEDVRNTARFFFVESIFPLVATEDLYQKLTSKYGERTSSTYEEKSARGAYVWEKPDGYLVQWIEPYNDKPYTRSLYYISRAIKTEIEKDMQEFQFQKEIAAVKNLIP